MEVEFTSEHCLRSEDQHGEGRSGMGAVREELQAEDGLAVSIFILPTGTTSISPVAEV